MSSTPSMVALGATGMLTRDGSRASGVMTPVPRHSRTNEYAAGAASVRRKRPSQAVLATGDHGTSLPAGMARTPIPPTGFPEVSTTRPSTTAGGLAAIRREAAVGVGAVAQAIATLTQRPSRTRARRLTDHDYGIIAAMTEPAEIQRFEVNAAWSGDAMGSGSAELPSGDRIAFAGATALGGSGGKANPEELLLTALSACFLNTWAIFLKKLAIAYAEPAIRVEGELGADSAGGFKMQKAVIHARVPATLLVDQKAPVEKTLALAEKYCIVSKVVRAAMPLSVEIEAV
jgi:lipoyl-dependent peroxiredoxin